ncbi:MAG: hypothetical protein ACR2OE_14075 [Thermomicrobiales bacterium]
MREIVQIIGYSVIGLAMIGVGIAFMLRRRQFSFGSILIITGIFVLGFAYYVTQYDNLNLDQNSPQLNPSAYGTPAFQSNP